MGEWMNGLNWIGLDRKKIIFGEIIFIMNFSLTDFNKSS